MTQRRIVIVGASASGLSTAEALRRSGFQGTITLVGAERHLPYDRPPLSKKLLMGSAEFDFVQLASEQDLIESAIELRLRERAVHLDQDAKQVILDGGERIAFDTCVIATGVEPLPIPGLDELNGVVSLRSYDDALTLRRRLLPGARLVIVGAGFIGLEVAATARTIGCEVDVVELASGALKGRLPEPLSTRLQQKHERRGVRFHFGKRVQSWSASASGEVSDVALDDGTVLAADVVLIGIGTVPAVGWLRQSGLALDNGIIADEHGLAAEHVYAVGDVANWYDARMGRNQRVEHRLHVGEQARAVAAHIVGTAVPDLDLPFFWTDQYDEKWQLYGYHHPDAELEIVLDDSDANRLVGLLRRDGRVHAVVGKNAVKQLMPHRRQLRESFTRLSR